MRRQAGGGDGAELTFGERQLPEDAARGRHQRRLDESLDKRVYPLPRDGESLCDMSDRDQIWHGDIIT